MQGLAVADQEPAFDTCHHAVALGALLSLTVWLQHLDHLSFSLYRMGLVTSHSGCCGRHQEGVLQVQGACPLRMPGVQSPNPSWEFPSTDGGFSVSVLKMLERNLGRDSWKLVVSTVWCQRSHIAKKDPSGPTVWEVLVHSTAQDIIALTSRQPRSTETGRGCGLNKSPLNPLTSSH